MITRGEKQEPIGVSNINLYEDIWANMYGLIRTSIYLFEGNLRGETS